MKTKKFSRNDWRIRSARAALNAYVEDRKTSPEDKRECYTYADAITNLLMLAHSRGLDARRIADVAIGNFDAETR